jgi:hypothetical protein
MATVNFSWDLEYIYIHLFLYMSYDRSIDFSKAVLYRLRSSASSLNFQYPLVSLGLSSSCLRLLPRIPLTHILTSLFPSTRRFRWKFLRKMRPIHLAFLQFTVCRIVLFSLAAAYVFFLVFPTHFWLLSFPQQGALDETSYAKSDQFI